MPNPIDELNGPKNPAGLDVSVIQKQLPVELTIGGKLFEPAIWVIGIVAAFAIGLAATGKPGTAAAISIAGLIPGLIFMQMKAKARSYLRKLDQNVQSTASQIDNYMEQRVVILENLNDLVSKSTNLDRDVMTSVAAYRGGRGPSGDEARNAASAALDKMYTGINVAFEAYPDLKSQDNIAEAMRQNSYLQKEITASRALYNDTVATWNRDIFSWPTKMIVAAREQYTTRVPFTASEEMKAAARGRFFND